MGVASDIKDIAKCTSALTMHQPWASNLVYGVKQTEGRSWQSAHKGWLWIHSAAKKPEDIAELEQHYLTTFAISGQQPVFPQNYPVSALIGCVYVTEVLSQDEFRKRNVLPHQDSQSPFVFMCSKFYYLSTPYQMSGQHKIWHLDRKLVSGLSEGLRPAVGSVQLHSQKSLDKVGRRSPQIDSSDTDDEEFDPEHPVLFKNWEWGLKN